jgi:short-subunit dehydrogenase
VTDGTSLVVAITGATSGIGLATARRLAADGHHLLLLARGRSALDTAATACRVAGAASVRTASVDVRVYDDVRRTMSDTVDALGRIDAVIHCAGVAAYGRFEDVPAAVFDGVVETNLIGAANVSRSVLPHFRARDAGTLVIVGSVIGTIAAPMMSAYAVSKWGIRSLARHLKIENADRPGVHVCCVSPGGVDTPIYVQAANYLGHVGRPPPPVASPERVAKVVVRLLDRPRSRVNVGAANPIMTFGFVATPALFDRLVLPMFRVVATDERTDVEGGAGNVFTSRPQTNRLHGEQGSALKAISSALRRRLGRRGRRRDSAVAMP